VTQAASSIALQPPASEALERPERLLQVHQRLRAEGFPVVSVVCATALADARAFLFGWLHTRPERVVVAPRPDAADALAAYRYQVGTGAAGVLVLHGAGALVAAAEVARGGPPLAIAACATTHDVLLTLLSEGTAGDTVEQLLRGLVPVGGAAKQMVERLAERQRPPVLRSPYEGLLFYMLECRALTRGQFRTNLRIPGASGEQFEVDLVAPAGRLVVEIDGVQHQRPDQAARDGLKQRDLEAAGYQILRVGVERLIEDPFAVWEHLTAALQRRSPAPAPPFTSR
jgi:very-short-patch-repair endonuclease